MELIHSLNIRSDESIFKTGIFKNWYLVSAIVLGILLQVGVVAVPFLSKVFNVVPLSKVQWGYVCLISVLPILIMELQKKINSKCRGMQCTSANNMQSFFKLSN